MEPSDIFVTEISWKGGGKKRPVLVVLANEINISVAITEKIEPIG